MLRSIVIRKEPILRGLAATKLISPTKKSAKSEVIRCFSTTGVRNLNSFRISLKFQNKRAQHITPWSMNFARGYADLPSHTKVALPALSPTMDSGTIVSWEKKEGDKLNEGDLLAEIETDKATMGFETPEEGYLAKIVVQAGEKGVKVGKLVCIIVENQEDIAAFKDFKDDGTSAPAAAAPAAAAPAPAAAPPPPAPVAAAPSPPPATASSGPAGDRVYASPMAKKLAETQQIRLQGKGSGVFGSIKSGDVGGMPAGAISAGPPAAAGRPAAPAGPVAPPGGHIDIPVSGVRGIIAKRLLESKQQIPHYYLTVECVVDSLMKFREKMNKKYEKQGVKLSVNDFVIKAVAMACKKKPETNAYWMGATIRQFDDVDVSVAVSTPSGLITPIVFKANQKGVMDISRDIKMLAGKARDNKLQPHEFQGGTVTVSNLGMYGVNNFCAVINPPQSMILAVGTTAKKLVKDDKNLKGFREVSVMEVTLSADHRVIDGAVAAEWLTYFRDFVEDPTAMIL